MKHLKIISHPFSIFLLVLLTSCSNEEVLPAQTAEQETPESIQLQPLSTPQPFIVEEELSATSITISWQTDSRAESYRYLLNFSDNSLSPQQGIPISSPPLVLNNLTPNTTYKISLCAVPRNTLLYKQSKWAEIEVATKIDTSNYPDWGEEPERPKEPVEPGEELTLCIENLCGAWQFYEWSASEKFPSMNTDIYIDFKEDFRFDLYQKNINFIGVVLFSGEYQLDIEQRTISGQYDDGTDWGASYFIEGLFENLLTWRTAEERTSYVRLDEIPEEIVQQARPATETRTATLGAIL